MTYTLTRDRIEGILKEEYKCFLDEMEIPPGIGRNTPLKENIFVIFTCLMNKIPLFITGKPGSSKTLAMNLVTKSMKGKSSSKEFFKKLPAIL
jgi:Cdc6-like AAA superfamily ATPase